jgi:hypothetical protein
VFPQRVMELPITSRDSHLLHILEAHADDLLSERPDCEVWWKIRSSACFPAAGCKWQRSPSGSGWVRGHSNGSLLRRALPPEKSSTVHGTTSLFVCHCNRSPRPAPAGKKWIEVTQRRDVGLGSVGREPIFSWEAKAYTHTPMSLDDAAAGDESFRIARPSSTQWEENQRGMLYR